MMNSNDYLWSYLFSNRYTMALICQYTIISIYYNVFLLEHFETFQGNLFLAFNYTYFFIFLKFERIMYT